MFRRLFQQPEWVIPIVAFFIFILFGAAIVYLGNCDFSFANCWVRWDSANYLDIVKNGHTLYHCTAANEMDKWCGNAGWAPLYPFFIRIVNTLSLGQLSLAQSGGILSNTFFLGYLILTAKIIEINSYKLRNWLFIFIVVFCPGNIYYHAVFPLSQTIFFMAWLFYLLKKERFISAGFAGALAILSYSIGFFLLAAMGCYTLYLIVKTKKIFHAFVTKTLPISVLGFVTLFIYDYFSTAHWNALFMVQSKYGHSINSPLKIFGMRMQNLLNHPYNLSSWIEIQNLVTMAVVLFMVVYTFFRKKNTEGRFLATFYLLFFWFLPYSASTATGLYRNAAMLGPGTTQNLEVPNWALLLVLAAFIAQSFPLGILFIQSTIV